MRTEPIFDGITYDPDKDCLRLKTQLERVAAVMIDGNWHTIPEVVKTVSRKPYPVVSDAAVGARIRDLRKRKFGGFRVERRRIRDGGTFEYRLVLPETHKQQNLPGVAKT